MSNPADISSGREYLPLPIDLKVPSFEFIYRMSAVMADARQPVGPPFGGSQVRVIMPIAGGQVRGPGLAGEIVHMSGADWGTITHGADFMRLDARYTVKTDDGVHIFIKSKGVFSGGPNAPPALSPGLPPPVSFTQNEVEWFTRLQFEAPPGKYNWMNGVFAIGVLAMSNKQIIIDAYRITNFPGLPPRDMNVQ